MPTKAPLFRPVAMQSRQEQNKLFDRARRRNSPWRLWYGQKAWKARRAAQLLAEPLCARCKPKGYVVAATVANHKVPHRGDWVLFIEGELESLCKRCHDRDVQAEERAIAAREAEEGEGQTF
jgi:5-methylcytosine-specific restriction protein A